MAVRCLKASDTVLTSEFKGGIGNVRDRTSAVFNLGRNNLIGSEINNIISMK